MTENGDGKPRAPATAVDTRKRVPETTETAVVGMIGTALRLVFARRGYLIGAVLTTLLSAALYAYAGQIVTLFADGTIFVDPEPTRLAALVVLSLLMGLVLPVQVYVVRRAAWRLRQGGTGLLGFVAGLGSLTCCSPLLLPAILSFAGFSGSALLSLNVTLYRYFGPLAALSAVLLALSLVLAARDITRACTPAPARKQPGRSGAYPHTGRAGRRWPWRKAERPRFPSPREGEGSRG